MANDSTFEQGRFVKIPVPAPLSVEMYVSKGETLATTYSGLRDKLEKDVDYEKNACHSAIYGHLPLKLVTKDETSPTEKESGSKGSPAGKVMEFRDVRPAESPHKRRKVQINTEPASP